MSDSGYTPSLEELRDALELHWLPEIDGKHGSQGWFDRFVAEVRADQTFEVADRLSSAFAPQGSRGEDFEIGFCAALDWLRAEGTAIRAQLQIGESK